MPQRPQSAFFTPSRTTTARSVFDALVNADIDHTEIHCLQRKLNGEVVVTFKTIAAKKKFLRLNSLHVNSENYALQDIDKPLTFLTIYDAPFELSDLAIIKRLAPFCEVLHYRRGKHSLAPNIYNGLRNYRVRVIKPIPNYLRFGKYQIYIKYSGRIPTCRNCNLPGHFSNVCPNKICFNCENFGHEARDCHLPTLCCICKEEGHRGIGCDYSWVFPCTRGIPTDENSDVAIESSDDGMSEYGRDEDYASLVSVPPASNETIEEPTSVPAAVDPPSTATLLPSSSDDSPSPNILDSQGLLIPSEAPPKPPPRRLPARLSSLSDSRFGFGPSFCFWINTLYNGANMRIIVNEWLSDAIPLSRGVRQGDSLSPLLYILCVETLACKIRNNPDMEGFLLPGARGLCYKVGVYADDTTCIVKSYRSLQCLFRMINVYEGGSGARLNVTKTEAMWLGAWRSRGDQPLGL